MKKVYLIAIVVAIVVGLSVFGFASVIKNEMVENENNKVDVVIVQQDIKKDTTIDRSMLGIKRLPKDAVSENSLKSLEEAEGKISLCTLYAGDQINKNDVITIGDKEQKDVQLSYELKKGEYAVNIPVDSQKSAGYFAKEGDRVNILFADKDSREYKRLYTNVYVIRVGNDSEIAAANGAALTSYSSVTVVVDGDKSKTLNDGMLKNGTYALELYSHADALEYEKTLTDNGEK